ncbi:cytochrome c oxidase subunit 5B, mitochondrial [Hydra vulgaris]|nr:cytochrome c oxidase subunit 5B, mitochondrial [Hydra vulgaris]
MAVRLFTSTLKRSGLLVKVARLSTSSLKYSNDRIPTDLEIATGTERKEIEAILAGNPDPFNMHTINKGPPGTREAPTLVPSMCDERIIGCICDEESTSVSWMVLKKGPVQRCHCGKFFQLVHGKTNALED